MVLEIPNEKMQTMTATNIASNVINGPVLGVIKVFFP